MNVWLQISSEESFTKGVVLCMKWPMYCLELFVDRDGSSLHCHLSKKLVEILLDFQISKFHSSEIFMSTNTFLAAKRCADVAVS